jgi:O-antigen ligase
MLLTMFFFSEMRHRLMYFTLFLTMLFLLFNTYSRSAWAGFLISFSTVGALRYRNFYLLFVILTGCIILISPLSGKLMFRLQADESVMARVKLTEVGWDFFKQHPVLGHGIGSFRLLTGAETEKKGNLQFDVIAGVGGAAAHNEYIRILVEGGLVTFLAFLYLMYKALRLAVQILGLTDATAKNYGGFLIGIILAIILMGIPGVGFANVGFYFWTFAAFGEIYYRSSRLKPQSI